MPIELATSKLSLKDILKDLLEVESDLSDRKSKMMAERIKSKESGKYEDKPKQTLTG